MKNLIKSTMLKNTIVLVVLMQLISPRCAANEGPNKYLKGNIIQSIEGDLDEDGIAELVILAKENKNDIDGKIYVFINNDGNWEKQWESLSNPIWKIWIADANNDGRNDLNMALYKHEKSYNDTKNRLYIYDWNGRNIFPIWKGTSLSKPFIDLLFMDINSDGKTELISLEKGPLLKNDAKRFLVVYQWNGFGFRGIKQLELSGDCQGVQKDGKQIKLIGKKGLIRILKGSDLDV